MAINMETLIPTNFHVVGSAVKVEEEWDPKAQKEVKRERREPTLWGAWPGALTDAIDCAKAVDCFQANAGRSCRRIRGHHDRTGE